MAMALESLLLLGQLASTLPLVGLIWTMMDAYMAGEAALAACSF